MAAYEREALREWKGEAQAPHGHAWFSSFHASAYPADDPLACGRAALYSMMDLPDDKPREPKLSAMFAVGTDLEHHWVRKFAAEGTLLSKSPAVGDDFQTVFIDEEHWLSGASDAIILPPFWRRSHCVEIKTTSIEKVAAMRADRNSVPFSHPKYIRQLKTYIGLAHEEGFAPVVVVCAESWAITKSFPMDLRWCPIHESFECETREVQLEPPTDGTLIYSSREEPLLTASYYFEYDQHHMESGRARLAEWRDYFLRGEIPPHPLEGESSKWSVQPCKWCPAKRNACKPDYTAKVRRLSESNAIEAAQKIRPDYSYEDTRAQVLDRWHARDQSAAEKVAA